VYEDGARYFCSGTATFDTTYGVCLWRDGYAHWCSGPVPSVFITEEYRYGFCIYLNGSRWQCSGEASYDNYYGVCYWMEGSPYGCTNLTYDDYYGLCVRNFGQQYLLCWGTYNVTYDQTYGLCVNHSGAGRQWCSGPPPPNCDIRWPESCLPPIGLAASQAGAGEE